MRRIFELILVVVMSLSVAWCFAGCSGGEGGEDDDTAADDDAGDDDISDDDTDDDTADDDDGEGGCGCSIAG